MSKIIKFEKPGECHCPPSSYIMDKTKKTVFCRNCNKQIHPFDALDNMNHWITEYVKSENEIKKGWAKSKHEM